MIGGHAALAQQTVTSATLGGRVEDPSGAVVISAQLTATNLETNQKHAHDRTITAGTDFPILKWALTTFS